MEWDRSVFAASANWILAVDTSQIDTSRIKNDIWWMCSMASGTDRTGVDGFGGDSPVQDPVSWNSRGSGVTLSSAGVYNLGTKVMSIPNNHWIRALIPDENVGHRGFHDVLLHDMAEADSPYVATSDLMALCLDWPVVVLSGMVRHQLELEQMRHECKKNDSVMPRLGCVQPVEKWLN